MLGKPVSPTLLVTGPRDSPVCRSETFFHRLMGVIFFPCVIPHPVHISNLPTLLLLRERAKEKVCVTHSNTFVTLILSPIAGPLNQALRENTHGFSGRFRLYLMLRDSL